MYYKKTILLFLLAAANIKLMAQANPSIAVLPANNGIVAVGATLSLSIDVGNTGVGSIPQAKLRPVVTLPGSVTFLPNGDQTLPAGWSILTNTGSQLRFCNSTTTIDPSSNTTITLLVRGVTITPPQTFSGQIAFGNGTTCAAGTSVSGDLTADNTATSTIEVIAAPLPLTLLSFNATVNNCVPSLKWVTESEINTDRFEIESYQFNNNGTWKKVGEVTAKGTLASSTYSFIDNTGYASKEKIQYRLKMIDKDGSYTYSEILPLLIDCNQITVQAYPNPVQDGKLYVNISGANGKTESILLSVSGQVVSRKTITNGTNVIDVSAIANGTYILNVVGANGMNKKVKVLINK